MAARARPDKRSGDTLHHAGVCRRLMSCRVLRPCTVLWRTSPGMAVERIRAQAFATQRKSFKFVLEMNTKDEFGVLAVLVSLA